MQAPLQRLYKTKLVLLAVVAVVVGVALLFAAHWVATQSHPHYMDDLPLSEIGSVLFTWGLFAIYLQYTDKRDADARAMEQLDAALVRNASAIRDSVVDG